MNALRSRMLAVIGAEPVPARAPRETRSPTLLGLGAIAGAVMLFALWAVAAPLSGAIVASGRFVTSGQNRIVQHLEGGIVREILVSEGDVVEEGQVLVRLDATAAGASVRRLDLRRALLEAQVARLVAERDGADQVDFPQTLLDRALDDVQIAEILDAQQVEFAARTSSTESEIQMVEQRGLAIAEEMAGLEARRQAVETQRDLVAQELAAFEKLYEQGFTTLSRVLALRRGSAELTGERGQVQADIARARERMTEISRQTAHLRAEALEATAQALSEAEAGLAEADSQLRAARDVLDRLELRSPTRGVVVTLTQNTAGGVVGSGEGVLEIVPVDEGLVVEVQVRPQDIDQVSKGLAAQVRLSALNQRTAPLATGEVIYVSADTRGGGETGTAPHYVARVRLDDGQGAALQGFDPAPGMPAEVYISTGSRSFADYLLQPLYDSFSRAFREG